MKIGAIAGITFKEAKRDRILYLLFFFAALGIVASRVLAILTVGDRVKIIKDVGLASIAVLLVASVTWGRVVGLYASMASMGISMSLQTGWLWLRSRDVLQRVAARDAATAGLSADPQIRATNIPG